MQLRALLFQRAYFRHVSPGVLPQRAKLAPVQVAEMGPELLRFVTYSPYDPIELPKVLFENYFGAFEGRSLRGSGGATYSKSSDLNWRPI